MSRSSRESEFRSVLLAELLLDPNNIRLIDDPLYRPISDEEIAVPEVQEKTTQRLQEEQRREIRDLVDSISRFGWLDIEPLRIRTLSTGGYVVIDGNRRVVALRELKGIGRTRQSWLPGLAQTSLEIRVILENEPESRDTVFAHGLRHTTHREPWTSFSAAFWRREVHRQHDEWPARFVMRGINREAPIEIEEGALELCTQYRRSRWGRQFHPDHFTLFRAALSNHTLREWLSNRTSTDDMPEAGDLLRANAFNKENLQRLFSWVSVDTFTPPPNERDSDVDLDDFGPVDTRAMPVLRRISDIRRLVPLLSDPGALAQLDVTRSLDMVPHRPANEAAFRFRLDDLRQTLIRWENPEAAPLPRELIGSAQAALVSLHQMLASAGEQPVAPSSELPWPITPSESVPHFSSLQISNYRGLSSVTFSGFGQINLLVGVNNAGKTSVLESLYLLSRQSDPRGLLDTLRARLRTDPESRPEWLVRLLPREIRLDGTLRSGAVVDVLHSVSDTPVSPDSNLAAFLGTLHIASRGHSSAHVSTTEFYANRPRRTQAPLGSQAWLVRAILHSPFSLSERAMLTNCYERSIEEGTKPAIVDFIRDHIDNGVEDIELANTDGRFVVQHRKNGPLDLSFYGEGMQRIFEVGTLFAAHPRGILLIDEFENALHTSVLLNFSRMVHELAVRFEVQVFLSTHSKETVDSFITNGFRTEDVVAFALRKNGHRLQVDRFSGPSLRKAIEAVDVDIRRL